MTNVLTGRLFSDGAYTDERRWMPAEDYERLQSERDHWLQIAREKDAEIDRLHRDIAERDKLLTAAGRATQLADERAMAINKVLEHCYRENVYGAVRNELEIASGTIELPAGYKVIDNGYPFYTALQAVTSEPTRTRGNHENPNDRRYANDDVSELPEGMAMGRLLQCHGR